MRRWGDWYGVSVDASGRVVRLDLSGRWDSEQRRTVRHGLTGPIPPELGSLTNLEGLYLRSNDLTGAIPPELANLTRLASLSLSSNDLTGLIPPELGKLTGLTSLSLYSNDLTGPIPAEFGKLTRLTYLDLDFNRLTGPIPPDLGNLTSLAFLSLSFNPLLEGTLPPEFGNLASLVALYLYRTDVGGPLPPELGALSRLENLVLWGSSFTGPIPPELGNLRNLERLDLDFNNLEGPIPPELGKLGNLERLELAGNYLGGSIPPELGDLSSLTFLNLSYNEYLKGEIPSSLGDLTSLETLRLDRNQLIGPIPPELGDLRLLESLDLYGNQLTGPVPESLTRLAALRTLKVYNNSLSGPLPDGMGSLRQLEELWVGNNPEMSGPLPADMADMTRLRTLKAGGTALCAPDDAAFLDWLAGVPFHRVARCKRAIAYLTQAVQSRTDPVPLIAGEPALLRAFVASPDADGEAMPRARAVLYLNGSPVYEVEIEAAGGTIPRRIEESEGSLDRSINADVPGALVQPGLEFVVDVDPDGMLDPALGVTGRIPRTGRMAVDVVELRDLQLTVVPFLHRTEPDSSILAITEGMANDPATHPMLAGVRVLLPVGGIDLELHDPVLTSDNLGFQILSQTEFIRQIEGRPGYWLGMQGPVRRGLLGVVWDIPSWSAFSQPLPTTVAHEIGHNMGLFHAPCGGAGSPDPLYPHPRGLTDSWGYDRANGRLVSPYSPDLMSYCGGGWIGDYHRANALRHRMKTETLALFPARVPSLVVWGGLDADGKLYLEPAFLTDAMPTLPPEGDDFTLRATTESGSEAFALRFDMPRTQDDDEGRTGFVFSVPVTWTGALESIVLVGGNDAAVLNRDTDQPLSILRDRATGQIRAFLRGPLPMAAGADAIGEGADPEVLYSAGIPDWN